MLTIYTILFQAPHMQPLLFAASSRSKLGNKVRDHVNQLCAEDSDHGDPLGQYTDLDEAAAWLVNSYGFEYEIEAHVEDV